MELTEASGGEAHIDSSKFLSWREFLLGDLVGPASVLHVLVIEIEGVPDRADIPAVGTGMCVRAWIFLEQGNVLLAGIGSGVRGSSGLLGREASGSESRDGNGCGSGFMKERLDKDSGDDLSSFGFSMRLLR